MMLGARVARSILVATIFLATVGTGLVVGPAVAGADDGVPFTPKICTGGGAVYVTQGGPKLWFWSLHANGSCQEREPIDQSNPSLGVPILPLESISLDGSGTSNTLGICDSDPKSALVNKLNLNVDVNFTDFSTGTTVTQHENWSAPVTTFPVMTLFVTSTSGTPTGAGVVVTHMFGGCGNGGNGPSALFSFAEVVPANITP